MKRSVSIFHRGFTWLVLSTVFLVACNKSSDVVVATSANMQFAMEEICQKFTEKTGSTCDVVVGSSGKLTAQILEGAPYDIFVSADLKYPREIFSAGLSDKPKVYAQGHLVLWTAHQDLDLSLENLGRDHIKHIAIANPKSAPYGQATQKVINGLYILNEISDKLVFGESISQVNQFVESKACEVGFTAKSVVLSPNNKTVGKWIDIDDSDYNTISQAAVIIKRKDSDLSKSQSFFDFLFSSDAAITLNKFGYTTDDL